MASKPSFYWDACMFYEVLGDEPVTPEKKAAIQEILEDNQAKKNLIVCSVLTHLEVIPSKIEQKKPGAETQYLGIFDGERFVDIEISRNILMRAREIREYYYRPADPEGGKPAKIMDAADAAHLATATIYNVEEFHTRDDDEKGFKVPLLSLYKWSGVDKICNKYPLKIVSPEHIQKVLPLDESQKKVGG
jgi:PIN domain